MKVVVVPVNQDNYAYLLIDEKKKRAAAVDPAEPKKVLKAAEEHGCDIDCILTTHHHADHSAGNQELFDTLQNILVVGGDDRVPCINKKMKHEEVLAWSTLEIRSLATPCHTSGHICYYVTDPSDPEGKPVLFTGDTLFIGGCGRFFEGNASQMHHALNKVLSSLPDSTLVYCGHEYTVSNLRFAQHIEPDNQDIKNKLEWAKLVVQRVPSAHPYTVPSTLGDEKRTNPFMRVHLSSVVQGAGFKVDADEVSVMQRLREEKNNFK